MTETLRGPLLTAQREVAALDIRRRHVLDKVGKTESAEKTAYTASTNWQETLQNTAKKAGFVSQHAKLKAELGMVEVQIRDYKQVFGLELFQVLVDLEDIEGWLPTVRDIRSIYDQCRRDIEKIHVRRKEKEAELFKLGGVPMTTTSESSKQKNDAGGDNDEDDKPSYFKQVAAAEAGPASSSSMYGSTAAASVAAAAPVAYTAKGGPLSYSVPAAPTMPQHQQYPDPFTSPSPQQQQHPFGYSTQQQPVFNTVDPFASSSHGGSGHDSFGSQQEPMGGSFVPAGAPQINSNYDPFSSLNAAALPPNGSNHSDPFGSGAAASQQQHYDPFAALDSNGERSQQRNDNPLFRY